MSIGISAHPGNIASLTGQIMMHTKKKQFYLPDFVLLFLKQLEFIGIEKRNVLSETNRMCTTLICHLDFPSYATTSPMRIATIHSVHLPLLWFVFFYDFIYYKSHSKRFSVKNQFLIYFSFCKIFRPALPDRSWQNLLPNRTFWFRVSCSFFPKIVVYFFQLY